MPETGSTEGIVLNENAAVSISDIYLRVQAVPGCHPWKRLSNHNAIDNPAP